MLITCLLLLGAVDGGVPGRVQLEERTGPGGEISGVVIDERGAPVRDAKLTFRGGTHHNLVRVAAQTGADGRFTATGVAPGMYGTMLEVEAPGFGGLRHSISHRLNTALELTIRIGKAVKVSGRIISADAKGGGLRLIDAPPAGANATQWRDGAIPKVTGTLGDDGRFSLEVLEGDYELEWSRPSGSRYFVRVHAPSGELRLSPSNAAVQGQVLSRSGSPLESAEVVIATSAPYRIVGLTKTDAQGRFSVPGLDDGTYTLEASIQQDAHSRLCRSQAVSVNKGAAKATMRFGDGWELRGQLLDSAGQPRSGIDVLAKPITGDGERKLCDTRMTTTDAQGGFSLIELVDAEVEVTALSTPPVTMMVKPRAAPVTLKMPESLPKRTITGVVVGADRNPIAGASVGGRTATDAQGRFTLERPPGPAEQLQLYRRCYERKTVAESDAALVVLERKPCLSATVVDAAKKPLSGSHSLQVQRTDGTVVSRCNTRVAEADCTLEAEFGALVVSGTTQDGRSVSTKVELKDTTKQEVLLIAP